MQRIINVLIRDKIATAVDKPLYICGNSDFVIRFDFDDEWEAFGTKTARFVYNGERQDVIFSGNECNVPIISNTNNFKVGVFAGELHTTTSAYVSAKKSILCGSGVPADPMPDVYAQIIQMLDEIRQNGASEEQIAAAVESYLQEHPVEGVTSEEVNKAIQEAMNELPGWAKTAEKPEYTAEEVGALPNTYVPPAQTAEQVGADPKGTAEQAVSDHNTNTEAHQDIRLALNGLAERVNAVLDSDDTTLDQLSEIVAYIKSNKALIDSVTTGKVSVSDIVDNLTTNVSNKPLSAAQGVALKKLIDAIVIPDALPSPGILSFSGAVEGTYNGSTDTNIVIPAIAGEPGTGVKRISTYTRNMTAELWQQYGSIDHAEGWSYDSAVYDNSHISIGDTAYIVGTVTDALDVNGKPVGAAIYGVVTEITDTHVKMTSSYLQMGYAGASPDTQTIVNAVLAALPTWTGGSY